MLATSPKIDRNFSSAVVANISRLPLEVQRHFSQNESLIPGALLRGFAIPTKTEIVRNPVFDFWFNAAQQFAEKFFDIRVDLYELFVIPPDGLPWDAIPVFDPGTSNRRAIETLRGLELEVWEEKNAMEYAGSRGNEEPTLHFIRDSARPDEDTIRLAPGRLALMNKNWLTLRGWALALALYHFGRGKYLDTRTRTWFPSSHHRQSGWVPCGTSSACGREIQFCEFSSSTRYRNGGAREAIPVPLR